MKRELYIKPSGKLFTLSRGKYKVRLKRVNEVLFSLNIEGRGSVLITAKNGDLFFENGKKSSEINVNDSFPMYNITIRRSWKLDKGQAKEG